MPQSREEPASRSEHAVSPPFPVWRRSLIACAPGVRCHRASLPGRRSSVRCPVSPRFVHVGDGAPGGDFPAVARNRQNRPRARYAVWPFGTGGHAGRYRRRCPPAAHRRRWMSGETDQAAGSWRNFWNPLNASAMVSGEPRSARASGMELWYFNRSRGDSLAMSNSPTPSLT